MSFQTSPYVPRARNPIGATPQNAYPAPELAAAASARSSKISSPEDMCMFDTLYKKKKRHGQINYLILDLVHRIEPVPIVTLL